MILPRQIHSLIFCAAMLLLILHSTSATSADESAPPRDPQQPINEPYTAKITKYTTARLFTSPLVDYLPASKTAPPPEAVLGAVSGAPGTLPSPAALYTYT